MSSSKFPKLSIFLLNLLRYAFVLLPSSCVMEKKKFSCAHFIWNNSAEMRDEFHIETMTTYDRAMIKIIIQDPNITIKSWRKNLAHDITLCYH